MLEMGQIKPKIFIFITLLTSLWVNVSEVFRYFVIVMPGTRATLSTVPNVADMNWEIFAIWGVWDTALTGFVVLIALLWSTASSSEPNNLVKTSLGAGSLAWTFFLLFWLGLANMNLARWAFIPIPLALSWIEMVVAAYVALNLAAAFQRQYRDST